MIKWLATPVRRYFNPRFEAVRAEMATVTQTVLSHDVALRDWLETAPEEMSSALAEQAGAVVDVAALVSHSVDRLAEAVESMPELVAERLRTDMTFFADHLSTAVAERIATLPGSTFDPETAGSIAALGDHDAGVANFATSHLGWASQAGLWFNPAITVTHSRSGVRLGDVNERIAEVPFVHGALDHLPIGARILDVGSTESTVALSLASLGYDVTAVDPRPYPLSHPNLTVHVGPVETYESTEQFDAVVALSSVEHFGLGCYELPEAEDADIAAVRRMHGLTRPGGQLVLTAPYGARPASSVERTYGPERLELLLEGWHVDHRSYLSKSADGPWMRCAEVVDPAGEHIVLVRATKPRE